LVTVALPIAVLIVQSASLSAFADAFSRASDSILRSVVFAAIGTTLLTLLGFFSGYLIHNRTLPLWRSIDASALFLFTLPGTVIGIGLISLWNRPITKAIYASPAIIILGYLAQYAVLPARMTAAILQRIPPSLEQAAQLCGASWFMTLRYIVAPLAKRGLIAQQQRVALARTLAVAPGIVLMDEPLSNLDDALNMQLRKEIVRLHGDLGFTLVYVTHSRDEAEALGARIIFLRCGRIDDAASAAR
jgi:ABC-type sulfate transport system permease component